MKKVNKALMSTVAILLSLVLISTSVLSGVFAKFVETKSAGATVSLKAFGLTLTVSSPSKYSPTYTYPSGSTEAISVSVPIAMNAGTNYDDIVIFTISNTSNVDEVKLILKIEIEGVETFAVSDIEGIPDGNHIPLGFTSTVTTSAGKLNCKVNTPNYWCMPTSNENLASTIITDMANDYSGNGFARVDDSLEVVVWQSNSLKITKLELGVRPFGTTTKKQDTGYENDLTKDEANILQAYLAERTNPAPQLKVTYTVSLEQVIPTTTNS